MRLEIWGISSAMSRTLIIIVSAISIGPATFAQQRVATVNALMTVGFNYPRYDSGNRMGSIWIGQEATIDLSNEKLL